MGLPIITRGRVIDKSTSNGTNRNGDQVTYYNLKLFDVRDGHFDNQLIGVSKKTFDAVNINDVVQLAGEYGGLKNKYWSFNGEDALIDVKSK